MGPRRRRILRREQAAERRRFGCLWLLFWVVLIVLLLGLIFGGWRKGTPVKAPSAPLPRAVAAAVLHSTANAGR